PQRVSVHAHPHDESPYGVRGLAGNMRDWCLNVWRRDGPPVQRGRVCLDAAAPADPDFRSVKGGAWGSSMGFSRAATRFGTPPGFRSLLIGFRLVRPWRLVK
ncbi:MAG: SUMF1/EgtB/PvdO family nonheme iron enzyme, partial [Byssovorax sp.]